MTTRPLSRDDAPMAGFSLVEVLVALVLTGLVLTGLSLATGQIMSQWARGLARLDSSERLSLAMDRLVTDLGAAEVVPAARDAKGVLFEGHPDTVTFVRTALGPNAPPGLEMVRIAAASENSGAGLARSTARYVPRAGEAPPPAFGAPVALLGASFRASFSYAGRDGAWRSDWGPTEELPRAVRIVVRDANGRTLPVSTTAVIHAELPAACVTDKTRHGCDRPTPFNAQAATASAGGTP